MSTPAEKAGWRPSEWYPAIGISRSAYYSLPPEREPRYLKFGTAKVIVETPAEYLRRIADAEAQREAA